MKKILTMIKRRVSRNTETQKFSGIDSSSKTSDLQDDMIYGYTFKTNLPIEEAKMFRTQPP